MNERLCGEPLEEVDYFKYLVSEMTVRVEDIIFRAVTQLPKLHTLQFSPSQILYTDVPRRIARTIGTINSRATSHKVTINISACIIVAFI